MRTTALSVAGLLGLVLLAPAASAEQVTAAADTCLGRPATVIGRGPTVTGTAGDDVIVSGTAGSVEALGG
ncbi:MAG TPA: hypothetical protein VGD39_06115, partial [Nocardioides sp.]